MPQERETASPRTFAVAGYLARSSQGNIELRFDDLVADSESPTQWRQWVYFTSLKLDKQRTLDHQLTEKEYAGIGRTVMTRLVALLSVHDPNEADE
jgi:hypothetical protein